MAERFIHLVRVERPPAGEDVNAARGRLGDKFPRAALRRMTHLGLLVGAAADGVALGPDDAVVYATSYGETRALEDYLGSFPTPSPLLFQTSIHPSAVQQFLIGRQQPLARLWPLAGRRRLAEQALETALLESAPRVWLTGGEERGTWLLDRGVASATSFAFGVLLSTDAAGALGQVTCAPATGEDEPCPTLEDFAAAVSAKSDLAWRGAGARWSVTWR
jgi:hypothetical protein